MIWESIEARLALLELSSGKVLKMRRSQSDAFAALSELPWTRATGRRDEIALVDERESHLTELLSRVWPDWKAHHADLVKRGLPPTPEGYKSLCDARRAASIPSLPNRINRRTAAAIVAPSSKASLAGGRRLALGAAEPTHDGAVRLRPPAGLTLRTQNGALDISEVARVLGEVPIPERAFLDGLTLEGRLRAVLLIENLGAWRDFPTVPGWLLAHVPGWNTRTAAYLFDTLGDTPFVHFGDVDPNGVKIYLHLRARRPDLRWFLPAFWFDSSAGRYLKAKWPDELDLAFAPRRVRELADRGLMLEQESVVVDPRVPDALEETLSGNTDHDTD